MKPHDAAPYDKDVLFAVRAFWEGKATDGQQVMVRDWLLNGVCQADNMSFFTGPDGERLSAFAEGKRHVANQLRKMLHPMTLMALDAPKRTVKATKRQEAK